MKDPNSMQTLVVELKHTTQEVDETRIELMMRELNRVMDLFDYKVGKWGTKQVMTKLLAEESHKGNGRPLVDLAA